MYQSSTRRNFLDILLDPTAIAIVGSLALHAILGAGLPLFAQLEPAGKKAAPTTVKVVELTPTELQRIPQAPPVPTPQVLPPTRPVPPSSPTAAPPRTTFSTAPQTIPFSPLRPTDGTIFKPPTAGKPKAVPPKKPVSSLFDPNAIFQTPTQTQKPKIQKSPTPKPSPSVTTPPPAKKSVTPPPAKKLVTPPPNSQTDNDGGNLPPTKIPPTKNPNPQAQQPSAQTTPANTPPTNPQPNQPPNDLNSGSGFYGAYTQAAIKRLIKYQQDIPGLVVYQKGVLKVDYPAKSACSKVKPSPYIVYMVAFDKVAEILPNDITGESLTQTVDKSTIFGDRGNDELFKQAISKAIEAATTADQSRPVADKGKRVLYQYRVEFNPASCKK